MMNLPAVFWMRVGRSWLVALLLGFLSGSATAQDSTLTRLIRQNQYPLQAAGAGFAGLGWDKLRVAVRQSQLVLVGEEHGLAQIPPFIAAVAQVLQPSVFVAEIDPYVAQTLTQLTDQPGLPTTYERHYPEALCFYDMREEFELARSLRGQGARLVGIDQVYGTTAAPFHRQLAELVKGKAAKAYLLNRAARYQTQAQAFEKVGNDDWVMEQQPPAAIDSLLSLTRNESPAARQMAQDYAASYAIYKSQSHADRVNLMKRNLLREISVGQPLPKMLFKFGGYHLGRGLSPAPFGEFYDLGNLVQNMVDIQGQKSLHLLVMGKQGTQAIGSNPNFPAKNATTYTATDKIKYRLFLDQVTGPDWAVIDLRPLRGALTAGKLLLSTQPLQRTILGYDYLIIIPETTASQPLYTAP